MKTDCRAVTSKKRAVFEENISNITKKKSYCFLKTYSSRLYLLQKEKSWNIEISMKKHFFLLKRSNRKKIWFLVSHHGQICFLFCSVFNHDASLLFCKSVLSRYFLWKINVVFRMLKKTIWQLLYQFFFILLSTIKFNFTKKVKISQMLHLMFHFHLLRQASNFF